VAAAVMFLDVGWIKKTEDINAKKNH